MFFLVEKMKSLVTQKGDVRMLSQKIVERRGTGFLHSGDDEIDALDRAVFENTRQTRPARALGRTTGWGSAGLPEHREGVPVFAVGNYRRCVGHILSAL